MIPVFRIGAGFVCLLLSAVSMAGINSWTTKGPPGGYFRFIAASPTDSNVIYAAYFQSLHKSVDSGATWRTIREVDSSIMGLAVDPANGNRIYLAVTDQGILRSDDGGIVFNLIASAGSGSVSGVAVVGTTVYYSGYSMFHRSADRGVTFIPMSPPPQEIARILADSAAPDSIFGFNSSNALSGARLIRSTDGGASWTQSVLDATTFIVVYDAVMVSSTVLAAATSNGIYVTTDAGTTWRRVVTAPCNAIAADPNATGYLFAACISAGKESLLRSVDFGSTFVPVSATPIGGAEGIVVSQSTASIVVANGQGVFRSTNGGGVWIEASPGPIATTIAPLVMRASAGMNARVYAYLGAFNQQQEFLYSTVSDDTWQRIDLAAARVASGYSYSLGRLVVKPNDGNTLYFTAAAGGVVRSIDGGTTWVKIGSLPGGLQIEALEIDPSNSSIIYVAIASPASGLYRSTDGGINWAMHAANLPTNFYETKLSIDPSDSSRMFLAARYSHGSEDTTGLYRSMDGGVSWSKIFSGQDVRDVEVSPRDSNRVYAATANGLQVSTDGGATFSVNSEFTRITNGQASAIVIDPLRPSTLYVSSLYPGLYPTQVPRSSYILRSVDDGQTFEVLRDRNASPLWFTTELVLDPVTPSLLYARTGAHGIAAFQVAPDLSVRISGHSGNRPIGTQSSFSVRADNWGPYAATDVQLRVTLPAALRGVSATTDRGSCIAASMVVTCAVAMLRNGESINLNIFYTPDVAMLHTVVATVDGHETDAVSSNNAAQATAYVGEVADLSVSVTPSTATVTNGDNLEYSIRIDNKGSMEVSVSTMTFTPGNGLLLSAAPTGCSIAANVMTCSTGALAAGGMRTYFVPVNARTVGLAAVEVSVTPATAALDPTSANNTATATVNVLPSGDLSIAVVDSADPAAVSTNFEYRTVVRNAGPDSMPNVTATLVNTGTTIGVSSTKGSCISGPGGVSCNLGLLAANEAATITMVSASSSAGSVSLQATVISDGTDRVTTNNSTQEFTTVGAPAATKSSGGGTMGSRDLALLLCIFVLSLKIKRCKL